MPPSFPRQGDERETARACVEFGFRVYRTQVTGGRIFDRFEEVPRTYEQCKLAREGAGKDGAWAVDYHTRLDMSDAITLSNMIEPLRPYFVEDLIRTENPDIYRTLRGQVKVPIAVGEQYGNRWDINELVENHLIDYARVTVPNTGGITEFLKIANICETHFVGLIPHFTGPISEAAMVHLCGIFPGTALMEMLGRGDRSWPYVLQGYDFRKGRMYPVARPGLGVEVDTKQLADDSGSQRALRTNADEQSSRRHADELVRARRAAPDCPLLGRHPPRLTRQHVVCCCSAVPIRSDRLCCSVKNGDVGRHEWNSGTRFQAARSSSLSMS